MISKIKKPVSILLSLIMVFSVFTIVPLSASAAVGDVLSEDDYLTFTAEEAGSTVTLKVASGSNLQYDLNGTGLTGYTAGTEIMLDAGDYVRFSGKDTTFNYSNHFSLTGKVAASGNVMSLRLDDDGKVQGLNSGCFQYMFYSCQGLTTAPELPETNLANSCYYYMFSGCTNLTTAPDLPATTLANSCYSYMFYRCTSLTQAPELPATELGDSCYYRMFYGCENLTKAPELPATELAGSCYCYMFSGCIKLTKAPELPATNLADSCYSNMFYGCTSLTELPALPATTLARTCYNYMFNGCSKICISDEAGTFGDITYSVEYRIPTTGEGTSAYNALYNMFNNTGGKFTGTPDINTTYYVPAPAATYTVTWNNWDDTELDTDEVEEGTTPSYDGETPTKAADSYYTYTFAGWNDGETTYAPNELPAATADVTYTAQFTSEARTFMVFVKKLTGATINVYDVSGETTVAQLKDILASQTGAPASAQQLIFAGKTLEDAKTLAEYNIVKESTIHLVIRGYTVTWKNWDGTVLETDIGVAKDALPSYDGATPSKAADNYYTYTFAGWNDGETTYAPNELPAATADVTYTAQFTTAPLPEVIKDCTYQYNDYAIYANVPFMENESDLLDGAITGYIPFPGDIAVMIDTTGYSYKFYDQTGTEIPATISYKEENAGNEGYGLSADDIVFKTAFSYTMPNDIQALYIVATEPAPAPVKLTLNVGENGKVVMNNGTFGNATDASNIFDIARPFNIAGGANAFIDDGDTCNLVEGGSINIATGGRVSFYVSADNTGVITAIPDEGYICTGWYNGDTLYSSDAALSYQSISEDMTLTAKFAPVPAFDDGVGERLAGYTLSLDGDIGVNFYMELAPEIAQSETAVMHFTIPNGNKTNEIDVPVSEATVSGKYHIFKCNVAAKEMTSVIKAQIIDGETTGTKYTYSVKEYANYLLTNADLKGTELEQAYAEASALVVAMLNYGANAQLYFTPDTDPDDLANSGCETVLSGVTAQTINKSTYTNELNDVAEFSGATLSLKTQTTLSLYFTSDVDLTFNCAHEFEVEKKSGYQIIRIRNIHAKNLMEDFTVTVTAGENTGSVTYSPMNYCYNVLSDETQPEALQNACRALYLYAEAAGVYFD